MAATITLKNIPDDLYERLKAVANVQHRSLNSEIIACLERTLLPSRIDTRERLPRARQIRASLPANVFSGSDIDEAIQQGRP